MHMFVASVTKTVEANESRIFKLNKFRYIASLSQPLVATIEVTLLYDVFQLKLKLTNTKY